MADIIVFRFGTGLGLIGYIFGDDHILNQKNAAYGFVTYTLLLILGINSSSIEQNRNSIFRNICQHPRSQDILLDNNCPEHHDGVSLGRSRLSADIGPRVHRHLHYQRHFIVVSEKKDRLNNGNCREKAKLNFAFAFLCRLGQNWNFEYCPKIKLYYFSMWEAEQVIVELASEADWRELT